MAGQATHQSHRCSAARLGQQPELQGWLCNLFLIIDRTHQYRFRTTEEGGESVRRSLGDGGFQIPKSRIRLTPRLWRAPKRPSRHLYIRHKYIIVTIYFLIIYYITVHGGASLAPNVGQVARRHAPESAAPGASQLSAGLSKLSTSSGRQVPDVGSGEWRLIVRETALW